MKAAVKVSFDQRSAIAADVRAWVEDLLSPNLMPLSAVDWLDRARRAVPPSAEATLWLAEATSAWTLRRRAGRPGASPFQKLIMYRCVGACEALVSTGLRPRAAAKVIAAIAASKGVRTASGAKVTAVTVYAWWKTRRAAPGARLACKELVDGGATVAAVRAVATEILGGYKVGR